MFIRSSGGTMSDSSSVSMGLESFASCCQAAQFGSRTDFPRRKDKTNIIVSSLVWISQKGRMARTLQKPNSIRPGLFSVHWFTHASSSSRRVWPKNADGADRDNGMHEYGVNSYRFCDFLSQQIFGRRDLSVRYSCLSNIYINSNQWCVSKRYACWIWWKNKHVSINVRCLPACWILTFSGFSVSASVSKQEYDAVRVTLKPPSP